MKYLFFVFSLLFFNNAYSYQLYEVEKEINDEIFIINGEQFKAKTYCFNLEEGDNVIFLDGSPFGACASAQLFDVNSEEICEVWCE